MGQTNDNTKRREWKQLSEKERYQIEALVRAKKTPSQIAKQLGRDRRTIERELARGSVNQRDSQWRERMMYCADVGQRVREERAANKGRSLKIGKDHALASSAGSITTQEDSSITAPRFNYCILKVSVGS